MYCCMPGFPVLDYLLELAQTHVHSVSDAIQPSHPLLSPSPPAFSLSQYQGLISNELARHIRWPKYWSFSFSISPFSEYSGLISFRIDWWISLQSKGLSRVFSQHHSSKASILLKKSIQLSLPLSHPYVTAGKTIALTRQTFVGKVMPLLFNAI